MYLSIYIYKCIYVYIYIYTHIYVSLSNCIFRVVFFREMLDINNKEIISHFTGENHGIFAPDKKKKKKQTLEFKAENWLEYKPTKYPIELVGTT